MTSAATSTGHEGRVITAEYPDFYLVCVLHAEQLRMD